MFSVAEFSELSPLQKFSLCIFALLLQDLELKLSQNWFCDVTTLWSTAARIELSCTVLYMIWSCDSYLFTETKSKSCSKTANLPSSVSVDGCVAPGFYPLVRWTSCRTTKRWIQTLHFVPKMQILPFTNRIKTTIDYIPTPTVLIWSLKEHGRMWAVISCPQKSPRSPCPSCSSLRLMACL